MICMRYLDGAMDERKKEKATKSCPTGSVDRVPSMLCLCGVRFRNVVTWCALEGLIWDCH